MRFLKKFVTFILIIVVFTTLSSSTPIPSESDVLNPPTLVITSTESESDIDEKVQFIMDLEFAKFGEIINSTLVTKILTLENQVKEETNFNGRLRDFFASFGKTREETELEIIKSRLVENNATLPDVIVERLSQVEEKLNFLKLGKRINVGFGPELRVTSSNPFFCGPNNQLAMGNPIFIHSPNHYFNVATRVSNFYPNDANCEWLIEAPPGYAIHVEPNDTDIENCAYCDCDYVEYREGILPMAKDSFIARSCGHTNIESFYTRTDKLYIKFKSNYGFQGRGFKTKLSL